MGEQNKSSNLSYLNLGHSFFSNTCLIRAKYLTLQVAMSDIVEHFNGSETEAVVELITSLESEFVIYKKNNLYRLL